MKTENLVKQSANIVSITSIAGWVLFALFFAWFWRIYDLFGAIPAYGDALEVVWGIEWTAQQLGAGQSLFFYEGVFHPAGWHTGTLAHTPLLFLIAQPFNWIGGSNFAYNMLSILPLFITFIGAKRFFKLYTGSWSAILAALVYTFITTRTNRVHGHLHIYWATTFLPYLAYAIEQSKPYQKLKIAPGIWWGIMLNFSLYSLFLAPLTFLLLGRNLVSWRTWRNLIATGIIALLIGSGALFLFYSASQTASSAPPRFDELVNAGIPLNALWIPSIWHPIDKVSHFANGQFHGTIDESGYANWGAITGILALIGTVILVKRREGSGRILFTLITCLLAMGLFLRWDNLFVETSLFSHINHGLWEIGRLIKPDIFVKEGLPPQYKQAVPLPGYLLTILMPFYESARIVARFALVGGLGALTLAAVAIDKLPRWIAIPFAILWMIELLPVPVTAHPLTHTPHPAHQYMHELSLDANSPASRVDIDRYLMHGGEALWGSWTSGIPTASIIGSFMPAHTDVIFDATAAIDPPRFAEILRQFDVDYVLLHHRFPDVATRWAGLDQSDAFILHDCFDPVPAQPITWPVCVYEVAQPANSMITIMPVFGWSPRESWGVWTIDMRPRAQFVAFDQRDHTLTLEAFPPCHDALESNPQEMIVRVNGVEIGRHTWQSCETIRAAFGVSADLVTVGINEIALDMAYTMQLENDPRPLAIGFNQFTIE